MKYLPILLPVLFFISCSPRTSMDISTAYTKTDTFGEKIKWTKPTTLSKVHAELSSQDTIYSSVIGDVNKVCKKKGCWMTVRPENEEEPVFMVKFKNYGFFMPKDISGEKVRIQGKAFRQITDVETLRHYAQDAGKSESEISAITDAKEELIFVADAVELYRKKN